MKQVFTFLLIATVFAACTKDNEVSEQAVDSAKFSLDFSAADESNLGLYRGVFSTMDSSERGTFNMEIKEGTASRASLTLVNGQEYKFSTSVEIKADKDVNDVLFVAEGATFKFSVNSDGSNPVFTEVVFEGADSALKVLKETSRGAVTTQTGTWGCTSGCGGSGTWNLTFTAGDGTGDSTDITTMIMFNGNDIGTTFNVQNSCSDAANVTSCTIAGETEIVGATGGLPIIWSGIHGYVSDASADCSEAAGTWGNAGLSGTWTSDVKCFQPGNFPFDPIPITPNPEGTGCAGGGDQTALLGTGGFTTSGLTSFCTPNVQDIFYTWTATTSALKIFPQNPSDPVVPVISIFTANPGEGIQEIDCIEGNSSGESMFFDWSIGDTLLIRISAGIDIPFCIEEATAPVTLN